MINSLLRASIAKKVLLGYALLSALIILIAVASLASLRQINRLNAGILEADIPLAEAMDQIVETVLDQELTARRAAILDDERLLDIFDDRSAEFGRLVDRARALPDSSWVPFARLAELHALYARDFRAALAEDPSPDGSTSRDGRIRESQEDLIRLAKGVAAQARQNQNERTAGAGRLGSRWFWLMLVFCVAGVLLSLAATVVLTRTIAGPLSTLRRATERISNGDFDGLPEVARRDELGDLFRSFAEMARRVKRMEVLCLDANPLTRLPGSIALENVLHNRLESGAPLAFCLVDLDNFKAYNDRYGYARGSELIKEAARVVEAAVVRHGAPEDFVGHIGGDDFAVITAPDRSSAICADIVAAFDKAAPAHYDADDLARGFIRSRDRQGRERDFPVMTVSIAVVTNLAQRLDNPIQVGERAAELKEYAKSLPGSKYVVDRRRSEHAHHESAAPGRGPGAARG